MLIHHHRRKTLIKIVLDTAGKSFKTSGNFSRSHTVYVGLPAVRAIEQHAIERVVDSCQSLLSATIDHVPPLADDLTLKQSVLVANN